MSITAALRRTAARYPEAIAVSFDDGGISWAALDLLVDKVAAFITAKAPQGTGVALALPNSPVFIAAFLGAARAGREAQVLDPEWSAETTLRLVASLRPGLLMTSRALPAFAGQTRIMDAKMSFAEVALLFPDCEATLEEPEQDEPFYVGFTSGSTGLPKGYRRTHKSWLRSFSCDQEEFGLVDGDIILTLGSFTHSTFLYALIKGLNTGVHVVVCRLFHVAAVQRLLRHHRVTIIYGVPSQLLLLIEAAARYREHYEKVRLILSGGAKWQGKRAIQEAFPAAEFIEFYGASELSYVTLAKASENVPPMSVGRPFPGVAVTIRDWDGLPVPQGTSGLIFVESDLVFLGYATGNSDAMRCIGKSISVGDVGYFDENGFLHLVGRADRVINYAGKKIHPEEVEAALLTHPEVEAAAVFGVEDQHRGQMIVAALGLKTASEVTRATLIRHLRAILPVSKIPKRIGVMNSWPTTLSGKTDFRAIAVLWQAGNIELLQ